MNLTPGKRTRTENIIFGKARRELPVWFILQLKILCLINPDVFIENKICINRSIVLTLVAVSDPFFVEKCASMQQSITSCHCN